MCTRYTFSLQHRKLSLKLQQVCYGASVAAFPWGIEMCGIKNYALRLATSSCESPVIMQISVDG